MYVCVCYVSHFPPNPLPCYRTLILSYAYKHTLRAIRPPAGLHSEITALALRNEGWEQCLVGSGLKASSLQESCFVEGSENKTDLEVSKVCVIDQPLSLTARSAPITAPSFISFTSGW